jgi:hypothetical protein
MVTMREEFELRSFIPAVEHPKAVLELAKFLESNKAILIENVATHGWLKTLARVGNGEVPEGDSMCYKGSFAHGVTSLHEPPRIYSPITDVQASPKTHSNRRMFTRCIPTMAGVRSIQRRTFPSGF